MKRRNVLAVVLVALGMHAAPSSAQAALSAKPALETRDGAARLVVTVTSPRGFTVRTRPRGVKVVAAAKRYVLRRSGADAAGSVWSTAQMRGASGIALYALAGKRVVISVRTRAGTTTLRRRVAPPRASERPPAPPIGGRPPSPPPGSGQAESTPSPAAPKGEQALAIARQYLGTSYRWGGSTPATGFDAAGLMQWSYRQVGVEIPRLTDMQFQAGTAVAEDAMRLGDLVFFRDPSGYVHHVGMFAGKAQFIHAPHTGDVVKLSSLDEPYYRQQFAGARRFAD